MRLLLAIIIAAGVSGSAGYGFGKTGGELSDLHRSTRKPLAVRPFMAPPLVFVPIQPARINVDRLPPPLVTRNTWAARCGREGKSDRQILTVTLTVTRTPA
jgi:hypothetical protein